MSKDYIVAIDLETTGIDPSISGICEIGAVFGTADGEVLDFFREDCNPGEVVFTDEARRINGFTDERLRRARPVEHVVADLQKQLEVYRGSYQGTKYENNVTLLFHNAIFDCGFLQPVYRRTNLDMFFFRRVLCTVSIAFAVIRPHMTRKLAKLAELFELTNTAEHSALNDALTTFKVYSKLMQIEQQDAITRIVNTETNKFDRMFAPTPYPIPVCV